MDDLISEFITETAESLSLLDLELVKLEQNPDDPDLISSIFRLMHTIKGTCGFLGLPRLESVAHASENVLGKFRDKELQVTPEAVTLILESLDTIKMLVEHLGSNGSEPDGSDEGLIGRLNAFVENGGAASSSAAEEAQEVAAEEEIAAPQEEHEQEEIASVPELHEENIEKSEQQVEKVEKAEEIEISKSAKEKAVAKGLETEPKDNKDASVNQSIRVNIDVLENLIQMVGELVLTRNQLMQIARTRHDVDFVTPLQRLSSITSELQEGIMKTRMQPIGNAWAKFPRLIRDLTMELGKKVELKMVGAETELDRQVLEMIKDPLTHMVRNSADHGIEMPKDRVAAGKPDFGTITLSSYHEGGHIIIEIADDGRGLNIDKIKEKAISNGLATESELEGMSEQQIAMFIFKAGFSTADKVTSVSGRGVGMDVVKTNIEKIGGSIEVKTKLGKGSTFYIKIPLTLAIVSVLIVESGKQKFAIPQIAVNELVKISPKSGHQLEYINNTYVLRLRNRLLPLISLSKMLGFNTDTQQANEGFVVVCKIGANDFGVIVDRVYDTEEIVVKPVSQLLKDVEVYSGCTILGDGSVIMILDPNGVAKNVGDIQIQHDREAEAKAIKTRMAEKMVNFLIFKTDENSPKAIPLELISRLEEIDTSQIENSSGKRVVQYRGDLMRLFFLEEFPLPEDGMVNVIVFNFENQTIGLVVQEILDIVEDKLNIKAASSDSRYLGSMVLNSRTTDIIDAGYILSEAVSGMSNALMIGDHESDVVQPYRVMMIDDSAFFRNMIAPYIAANGFNVITAKDAPEGLKILAEGAEFDAIVCDIEMPGMSGYEFAITCRADQNLKKIPLIAYTSMINKDSVQRGLDAGFDEYIAKTDRDGLIATLQRMVKSQERAEA